MRGALCDLKRPFQVLSLSDRFAIGTDQLQREVAYHPQERREHFGEPLIIRDVLLASTHADVFCEMHHQRQVGKSPL